MKFFFGEQNRPTSFADCVVSARLKFEHYFANASKQLLFLFPLDHMVKDGSSEVPFWTPPKVPPVPLLFSADNHLHVSEEERKKRKDSNLKQFSFVRTFAALFANMWNITPSEADWASVHQIATSTVVPAFVGDVFFLFFFFLFFFFLFSRCRKAPRL
jgi:hypothetical protein